jgi:hypothetical protein
MIRYVKHLSININQTFRDLWRLLEDNNVSIVVINDWKTSHNPSYIEIDIHTDKDYIYGELVEYLQAVLKLPDHMFRSKEFVNFMDTFSKAYNTLHYDMFFLIDDWAKYLQALIKEFKDELPPSKTSGLMPINKIRETYTAVAKSCIKDASQKILSYPMFSFSFKKLYDVVTEKETISIT